MSAGIAAAPPKACNVSIHWYWIGAPDYAGGAVLEDIEDVCLFLCYFTTYRQRMDGSDKDKTQETHDEGHVCEGKAY